MKKLKKRKNNVSSPPGTFSNLVYDQSLCIIGLGNPGQDEARHNVGFRFVDELARLLGLPLKKKIFSPCLCASILSKNIRELEKGANPSQERKVRLQESFTRIILVKPLSYMNRSGIVIPYLLRNYGRKLRFVVVADNMDLPPGVARLKKQGGNAGHKGLKSIGEYLGGNFCPLYIGVGRPPKGEDVVSHVLGVPNRKEQDQYDKGIELWATLLLHLISDDLETVMQRINSSRKDADIHV